MKKETKYDKFSRLDAKAKQQRAIATDKLIMESFPQDNWEEEMRYLLRDVWRHREYENELEMENDIIDKISHLLKTQNFSQNMERTRNLLKAQKEENDKEWREKIESLSNVVITSKQKNREVEIELKAKFTKDLLK